MRKSVSMTQMRKSEPANGEDWFRITNAITNDDGSDSPSTTQVYIYDEIGYWGTTAQDFVQQMMAIDTPNIEVHLNSPGGAIFDGVAIYNALKSHPAAVSVYVDSLAASAASFIAQAADSGQLFMARNATMMIHDGMAVIAGNEQDLLDAAAILNKLSNNIADMYQQRAGGTVDEWRGFMKAETWYSAQEAVDAGLADSVVNETSETTNKWDLTRFFNHAGRTDAPSPNEVRETVIKSINQGGTVTQPVAPTVEPPVTPPAPAAPVAPVVPAPVAAAPVAPTAVAPTQIFNIAGRQTVDPNEVQAHITTLETFQNETITLARKNFVASLASGSAPKIAATQIEALEKFALGLNAEQFKDWQASWDAAPASSLLGTQVIPTNNADGGAATPQAQMADRISVLTEILNNHQRSGVSQENIEKMPSWNELQSLIARQTQ